MKKVFSKSSKKLVFVSKSDKFVRGSSYIVILSPEFYWSKKVKLPVKKLSAAKKLAPSVYDGSLPKGDYSYEVRKEGEEFIVIAYDKSKISAQLEKNFPAKSDIKEIYFAQDALGSIKECTSINDASALSNMDGIIIQVPRKCTNTISMITDHFDSAVLGKNKIKLSASSNELLGRRDLIIAASVLGLLFLSFLTQYIVYKKEISSLDSKRADIVKENGLPSTMIQLRSIKKSLGKKFTTQKALRDKLHSISKIALKEGEYIEKLESSSKDIALDIHLLASDREDAVKSSIKKIANIKSSQMDGNSMSIRIGL